MLFAVLHLNHYTLEGVENEAIISKRINFTQPSKSLEIPLITRSLVYQPKSKPF